MADKPGKELPVSEITPEGTGLTLRLLETTDVHANLLDYDYHTDLPVDSYGLVRTAALIRKARAESINCLVFDNGDFLQGTPLSDLTARRDQTAMHPVIEAMNSIGYDAATLGNHEFNFGLEWLKTVLAQVEFPVTCANALSRLDQHMEQDVSFLAPYLLLPRQLSDRDGNRHMLMIGVIGLVPPQITIWDQFHLSNRIWTRGIVETARHMAPKLRAAGADIVILLAHSGIGMGDEHPMMENAVLPLSKLPGIDAILAGHSHQVFPSAEFETLAGFDAQTGALNDTPVVMAGFRGSHLGVLDLELRFEDDRWTVCGSRSEARPVTPEGSASSEEPLRQILTRAHDATIRITRRPIGHREKPLHSYLALAGQSSVARVITQAQMWAAQHLLGEQLNPTIPLLSASAVFKTGGRGGPDYFTDVPAGEIYLRQVADIYPFPNELCVLRMNGAQLRDWLERAASVFNQVVPGQGQQALIDPSVPGHAFDVIDGLEYQIDLSRTAVYDHAGNRQGKPDRGRIIDLRHHGRRIADTDQFALATNHYRAFGGGPYPAATPDQVLVNAGGQIVDLLRDYLQAASNVEQLDAPIWRFASLPGTSVIYETGPGVRQYAKDIATYRATDLGDTKAGFCRLEIPL